MNESLQGRFCVAGCPVRCSQLARDRRMNTDVCLRPFRAFAQDRKVAIARSVITGRS